MTRWLVDRRRWPARPDLVRVLGNGQGRSSAFDRAELDITDAAACRRMPSWPASDPMSWSTPRPTPPSTRPRRTRNGAYAVNGDRSGVPGSGAASASARAWCTSPPTTSSRATAPRPYDEDAEPDPRVAYGRTKLAGERAVAAAARRATMSCAPPGSTARRARNFVKTMAAPGASSARRSVSSTTSAARRRGRATSAAGLVALAASDAPAGIYHCTNAGETTWYGFTRAIFEEVGADPAGSSRRRPTRSPGRRRARPTPCCGGAWAAAGLPPMPHWRDAVE